MGGVASIGVGGDIPLEEIILRDVNKSHMVDRSKKIPARITKIEQEVCYLEGEIVLRPIFGLHYLGKDGAE